jgi:hypothetical protein
MGADMPKVELIDLIEDELLGEPFYGLLMLASGNVPSPPISAEASQVIHVLLAWDAACEGDPSTLRSISLTTGLHL